MMESSFVGRTFLDEADFVQNIRRVSLVPSHCPRDDPKACWGTDDDYGVLSYITGRPVISINMTYMNAEGINELNTIEIRRMDLDSRIYDDLYTYLRQHSQNYVSDGRVHRFTAAVALEDFARKTPIVIYYSGDHFTACVRRSSSRELPVVTPYILPLTVRSIRHYHYA